MRDVPDLYWYCNGCSKIIEAYGPEDITQDLKELVEIKRRSDEGHSTGAYFWSRGKLFMFQGTSYKEFPPMGLRKLLVEEYHYDAMHAGADKVCHKLS